MESLFLPSQDKSTLGNLPAAPGSSKLSGPVMVPVAFAPDERLSRPPPAATPSSMDLNGRCVSPQVLEASSALALLHSQRGEGRARHFTYPSDPALIYTWGN